MLWLPLHQMFLTGVLFQTSASSHSCGAPRECPTPCPHSLTSISLLVSPQQIRKASQHLHGDGPQSSRWPQCAARQLKRERRAGERKVGQDQGWVVVVGRGAASASGLHTDVCTCALGDTHTRVCSCPSALLRGSFPPKTNPRSVTKPRQCGG